MNRTLSGTFPTKFLVFSFLVCLLFSSTPTFAGIFDEGDAAAGEAVYKANCAACHSIGSDLVAAPGLQGIDERWGTSEELMVQWIQNPNAALKTGDEYITAIVEQWQGQFGIMTPQPVSEDDVKNIMAYIKSGGGPGGDDKVPDDLCPTIDDMAQEEDSSLGPWMLTIGILLLIILIVSSGTYRSLKNRELLDAGNEPLEEESYGQQIKRWAWDHRVLVSLISVFFVCYATVIAYQWAMDINVMTGYSPDQPIAFSHAVHACGQEIDCEYCHSSARKSKHAGIPSTNVCMNCHKGVKEGTQTGTEEIQKIYDAIGFDPATAGYIGMIGDSVTTGHSSPQESYPGEPIQWNKVHNLPDHVYFSHKQHVDVGGLDCRNCHGPVESYTVGRVATTEMINAQQIPGLIKLEKPTLTMGWCIECHSKAKIDLASSEYYEEMHERLKNSERGQEELREILEDQKTTVQDLGGWECSKCHY